MCDRGEMQGCAGLKEIWGGGGGGGVMVLVKRCEEVEGSFSLQKNIHYRGRIFATSEFLLRSENFVPAPTFLLHNKNKNTNKITIMLKILKNILIKN